MVLTTHASFAGQPGLFLRSAVLNFATPSQQVVLGCLNLELLNFTFIVWGGDITVKFTRQSIAVAYQLDHWQLALNMKERITLLLYDTV